MPGLEVTRTDKSFILHGDRDKYEKILRDAKIGARWMPSLKSGAGWIVPNKHEAQLNELLESLDTEKASPAKSKKTKRAKKSAPEPEPESDKDDKEDEKQHSDEERSPKRKSRERKTRDESDQEEDETEKRSTHEESEEEHSDEETKHRSDTEPEPDSDAPKYSASKSSSSDDEPYHRSHRHTHAKEVDHQRTRNYHRAVSDNESDDESDHAPPKRKNKSSKETDIQDMRSSDETTRTLARKIRALHQKMASLSVDDKESPKGRGKGRSK